MPAQPHPYIKNITFTPGVEHDAALIWPNGEGETPCSQAFLDARDERDALTPESCNLADLSPEDYQRWNILDDRLLSMQSSGHTGKPRRYDGQPSRFEVG